MSIGSSLNVLGNMIGPIIGGSLAGGFGISSVFVCNSVLFLLTCSMVWKYLAAEQSPHYVKAPDVIELHE